MFITGCIRACIIVKIQVRFLAWQQCSMYDVLCTYHACNIMTNVNLSCIKAVYCLLNLHQTLEIKTLLIITQTRHFMHPSEQYILTSSLMHTTQRSKTPSPRQWYCDLSLEEHLSPALLIPIGIEPPGPASFEVGGPIIFGVRLYTWLNYAMDSWLLSLYRWIVLW